MLCRVCLATFAIPCWVFGVFFLLLLLTFCLTSPSPLPSPSSCLLAPPSLSCDRTLSCAPYAPRLVNLGSSKGGDCDHLLLASSPGATPINLRAHGGDIMLYGTHVESWDMAAGGVHEDYEGGRRCVRV